MANPVRVVTDSTSDLTAAEAEQLGIAIVPLLVRFGDETFQDRVQLTPADFYARLAASRDLPTTSQPPPAAFADVFRRLLDDGADVVCPLLSAGLSGTVNSATLARDQLEAQRIAVIDTRQATLGAQTLVREAARLAREGAALPDIVARLEELQAKVRIVATIDSLEYLRRGGRIGRVAAFLGGLLSLKVLITVSGGIVVPLDRVRTRARALQRVEQLIAADAPFYGPILVGHSNDTATAEALAGRLRAAFPNQEILVGELGPVIGTHAGPGAVGAGYISDKPAAGSEVTAG